jgi:2-polyprenyl-3-methyl-5-hydroxy-6-metoxy-1,4-benzoquinol methylase
MNRFKPADTAYTEKYFFENYKKQYGKTYLEDFPNLVSLAKRRLKIIKELLGASGGGLPAILDIGCAYGAFLDTAKSEGFTPQGIDISEDAVRYVKDTLKIDAVAADFERDNAAVSGRSFNVVTLWYVIEHFADVKSVLEKSRALLPAGGILAFSTPNSAGISALKSKTNFLKNSPADHVTVWNAGDVKAQLQSFGFDVKKIVITGHHPERFPFAGRYIENKYFASKIIRHLFLLISKLFGLGDTFEVYAA